MARRKKVYRLTFEEFWPTCKKWWADCDMRRCDVLDKQHNRHFCEEAHCPPLKGKEFKPPRKRQTRKTSRKRK